MLNGERIAHGCLGLFPSVALATHACCTPVEAMGNLFAVRSETTMLDR